MATYIMLIKLSDEAAANLHDAKSGRDAGKKVARAVGVEWKASYLLVGAEYDVLVVLKAPDEHAIAKFALLGNLSGAVSTRIVRALTENETDDLISSIADLSELVA